MTKQVAPPSNQLFTVHVWAEQLGTGQTEWRGRVTSLVGGKVAYFRTWDALIAYMQTALDETVGTTNLQDGDLT